MIRHLGLLLVGSAFATTSLAQSAGNYDDAGELAIRITVQILTSDFNGKNWSTKSGAGTIIDDAGIVVTCSHVLGKHFQTRVRLYDGKIFAATVLGRFPEHDLAVLKFKAPDGLKVVPRMHEGILAPKTPMICLGFPQGRRKMCPATLEGYSPNNDTKLLAPDTPVILFRGQIIPGYSGGPLMTLDGGLAGVVFAIDPIQHIAIAVPIRVLKKDLEKVDWQNATPAPAEEPDAGANRSP